MSNERIVFQEADRLRAQVYRSQAAAALESGDRAQITRARDILLAWHEAFHSRNRPPELNCTGCQVWPVIVALNAALRAAEEVPS